MPLAKTGLPGNGPDAVLPSNCRMSGQIRSRAGIVHRLENGPDRDDAAATPSHHASFSGIRHGMTRA
jgi:hypothetical protein